MTFGWILLACLSVPFLGMHLLDDIRVLMILGLAAGVAIGLKTKVFRMLGAWVALSISTAFFVMIANESLVKAMVVAIFMAYIGFNGIITSQLEKLSSAGPNLVVLTTNGTTLQPGYYLFLTYTLLALFLSGYLTRNPQA